MAGPGWKELIALAAAYAIAAIATPAGISGAVLLLPFQVSVLGTPSPAVTPTSLLYNIVATPGALYRYARQHQAGGQLACQLTAGTLPGVIAGTARRSRPGLPDLLLRRIIGILVLAIAVRYLASGLR